ncbi:amino acid ABC transporter permease [Roseibium suaedae]|uniref:Amino acid ABC transporter membrane protein 2, PAAT family n=1 Tax=Roseibium suaedae TaxID=735517 RepID=A0A1M7NL86_9HYPH|nr:amino acid ABC transporter permease [Roseibium suaedae]SHN04232.1 amino acid ABC transporter membrane protein 2, PAAT family [Roseibium suaedae]
MSVISRDVPVMKEGALQAPRVGLVQQVRGNLFGSKRDALLTVVLGAVIVAAVYFAVDWLLLSAAAPWAPAESCAAVAGACWPFVVEKYRLILFGTYPYVEQWRSFLASVLLIVAVAVSMLPSFHNGRLVWLWSVVGASFYVLMRGGYFGLDYVQPERWNGLPVLLMLAIFGLVFAFPVGVLLSLARYQSQLPSIRAFAVLYIELVRGVPMIMVLFLGLFVLPLMMPEGITLSPLLTTMIALVFFHSAYFAEAVRGGLQSVPRGQHEAADSQGLGYVQKTRLIILPQALQRSMPEIMNTVLGAYKDTSLVVIIGIHDIMATAKMAFSDPSWQHYGLEAYLLVGIWYLATCWCLSSYSRWLEARTS